METLDYVKVTKDSLPTSQLLQHFVITDDHCFTERGGGGEGMVKKKKRKK